MASGRPKTRGRGEGGKVFVFRISGGRGSRIPPFVVFVSLACELPARNTDQLVATAGKLRSPSRRVLHSRRSR